MIIIILKLVLGFVLLVAGADYLVKGASLLAKHFGISNLVIGLTIVAFGTSAPEMVVSVTAALKGNGDLALGNVIGSNIFNTFFILGVSASITTLVVAKQLIRLDLPIMFLCTLGLLGMAYDGSISRPEGVLLLVCGLVYTIWTVYVSKKDTSIIQTEDISEPVKFSWISLLQIFGGLVVLILGSRFIVDSATQIAVSLGVSQLVIGLTIVAMGTSLPELATSVIASIKGEKDMAIGNIVGSNTFNILFILGTSAIINKNSLVIQPSLMDFDIPVLLMSALICLPLFISGSKLERWEGILFTVYYVIYTGFLIAFNTSNSTLIPKDWALYAFILPLGFLFIIIISKEFIRFRKTKMA